MGWCYGLAHRAKGRPAVGGPPLTVPYHWGCPGDRPAAGAAGPCARAAPPCPPPHGQGLLGATVVAVPGPPSCAVLRGGRHASGVGMVHLRCESAPLKGRWRGGGGGAWEGVCFAGVCRPSSTAAKPPSSLTLSHTCHSLSEQRQTEYRSEPGGQRPQRFCICGFGASVHRKAQGLDACVSPVLGGLVALRRPVPPLEQENAAPLTPFHLTTEHRLETPHEVLPALQPPTDAALWLLYFIPLAFSPLGA